MRQFNCWHRFTKRHLLHYTNLKFTTVPGLPVFQHHITPRTRATEVTDKEYLGLTSFWFFRHIFLDTRYLRILSS